MKKLLMVVWGLMLATSFSFAQSVDDIVNMNTEAMGGREKLAKLNSVKMTGTMNAQGMDIPVVISYQQMKGMRVDFEVMGTANFQMVNNSKGWMFMPVAGMSSPQEMPAEQYKVLFTQADIQSPLFNYKEKGNKVELAGKEMVDGTEAYKLNVTLKSGLSGAYYIDTKTNRLIKTAFKGSMNGQEVTSETSYSDYKQNKDGYWFPYTVTSMRGTSVFDDIETNVTLDERLFTN